MLMISMKDSCAEVFSPATHLCYFVEKLTTSLVTGQILVSASGDSGTLTPEDGSAYPANVSQGCVLLPASLITLHNEIETAGDITQSQKSFTLVGTEFGNPKNPMPSNVNFTTPGYNCSIPKLYGSK